MLVDSLGLAPFAPDPGFGRALNAFLAAPSGDTHDRLWQHCAFDLDTLRDRLGGHWRHLRTYNLDRARAPEVQAALHALFGLFGAPAIPSHELERIAVPTSLIWGRHDLATPLEVAEAASARHAWPLQVIEAAADDPPIEQPEAWLAALHAALARD